MSNVTALNPTTPAVNETLGNDTDSLELATFDHEAFGSVRVVYGLTDDGEPLFVARDVAAALGYYDAGQAVRQHCDDAKSLKSLGVSNQRPQQNQALSGLDPQTKLIPESDVYGLIFGSKLESAKRFKQWVTKEVIPSIRKHGSYSAKPEDTQDPQTWGLPDFRNPAEAAKAWAEQFSVREYFEIKSYRQAETINEHLEMVTVDEWRGLNHVYLSRSNKIKLGQRGSKLAGADKQFQTRVLETHAGPKEVTVGVYPRTVLDTVAKDLGIETNHGYSEAANAMAVA